MFGRRLYLAGYRVHHGLAGVLLIGAGFALVAHDWKDRPWPLKDWEPRQSHDECGRYGKVERGRLW